MVVIRSCFILILWLSISYPPCRRVCGGGRLFQGCVCSGWPNLAVFAHSRPLHSQFDDFLATFKSRLMQSSPSFITLRIYIHASGQVLFDGFDVSFSDSLPHRNVRCFYFGFRWFCLHSFDNGFSRFSFNFQFFTRLAACFRRSSAVLVRLNRMAKSSSGVWSFLVFAFT